MHGRAEARALGRMFALASAASLLLLPACGREQPAPEPRPVEIQTLAARCHPQGGGKESAFRDLLRLRDAPTAAAIPALAQVLRDHAGLSCIHRYAAAQALSTINTEDARRILESEVIRADFDGRAAFDYAFHWEMAPDARDLFLLQYVLRDAGDAPVLTLRRVPDAQRRADHLAFDVDVANAAGPAQEIMDPADRGGELLVFRAVGGHVARTIWPATCEYLGAKTVTLAPGETRTLRIEVEVKVAGAHLDPWGHAEGWIAGHAGGYRYLLSGPGEYEVLARWTSPRGRSVSAPVRVTVPDVK